MKKINNNIKKIKLVVTTDCNMECPYCMVKNTKEYMSYDIAIKSIEFFISNTLKKGQKKFIYFFGGEPLLNFNLIKEVVLYVNKRYKKHYGIEFVICSNFTLVTEDIIDFLIHNNIKVSISIGGKDEQHNSHRIMGKNKFNALNLTLNNINKLKQKSKHIYNIGVGFVIIKNNVKNIFDNFIYIVENLGLLHINFEFILDKEEWIIEDYNIFKKEYYKIIKYIFRNISKGKYIYLNNLNWTILLLLDFVNDNMSKEYLTEIYPNGDMLYSSFYFNLENNKKKDFTVGNIDLGIFNNEISLKDYFDKFKLLNNFKRGKGYDKIFIFLKNINIFFGEFIISKSKSNNNYSNYLSNIKDIYF